MKALTPLALLFCSASFCAVAMQAQNPDGTVSPESSLTAAPSRGGVDLNWTPPALNQLNVEATTRSSFSLDRTSLGFAAGLIPDSEPETRQAMAKLDGVSFHLLRFGSGGLDDEPAVDDVRLAYRLPGWKHVLSRSANVQTPGSGGKTDLWILMDGLNIREAVALIESPSSLTLVTVAGNISPVDLLHLRGHFGIPRFEAQQLQGDHDN